MSSPFYVPILGTYICHLSRWFEDQKPIFRSFGQFNRNLMSKRAQYSKIFMKKNRLLFWVNCHFWSQNVEQTNLWSKYPKCPWCDKLVRPKYFQAWKFLSTSLTYEINWVTFENLNNILQVLPIQLQTLNNRLRL